MDLAQILLGVLITLFLYELILGAMWIQPAWKFGLPLFAATRKFQGTATLPSTSEIQASEAATAGIGPVFRFRRFEGGSIAFREGFKWSFFGFFYVPLMRGRIEINARTNELVVKGYSWFWPFLAAALALYAHWQAHAHFSPEAPVAEIAGFVMLFVILWTIQALRYRAVANHVARMLRQ